MAGRSADPAHVGDYFGIRRDYPVDEFIQDVKPQGVTKSVHVTAMWGPGRALDESVASISRRQARISARNCLQCRSHGS